MSLFNAVERAVSSDDVQLNNLFMASDIEYVALSEIIPDDDQPRRDVGTEDLAELAESIATHGVLQPIIVQPKAVWARGKSAYKIVSGERRWRAAQAAGLETMPVLIRDIKTPEEKLEIQLIENLHRKELNVIERANAFKSLKAIYAKSNPRVTWPQVAQHVGITREHMMRLKSLLDLPDEIQEDIKKGALSPRQGRGLTLLKGNPEAQRELAEEAKEHKLSGDEIEARARAQREVRKLENRKTHTEQINTKTGAPYIAPRNYSSDIQQHVTGLSIVAAAMESDKKLKKKELQPLAAELVALAERIAAALA